MSRENGKGFPRRLRWKCILQWKCLESLTKRIYESRRNEIYESITNGIYESITNGIYESMRNEIYESIRKRRYESRRNEIYESITNGIYESITNGIDESMRNEIYESIRNGIYESMRNGIYESITNGIYESMRNGIYESMRNGIYEWENEPYANFRLIRLLLLRSGKKRGAVYEIVSIEVPVRRDRGTARKLGVYNSITKQNSFNVPAILHLLENGARPTENVRNFLKKEELFEEVFKKFFLKKEQELDEFCLKIKELLK